jgi:hypothetical protein
MTNYTQPDSVKFPPCLIQQDTYTYCGAEVYEAAEEAEQLASHPNRFIHGDMNSINQWRGGWVSRRADVDVVENKELILCSE